MPDPTPSRSDGRQHRRLAYLFGFLAFVALAQVAVTLPILDTGRAKLSLVLALALFVIAAVQAGRHWGRSRAEA